MGVTGFTYMYKMFCLLVYLQCVQGFFVTVRTLISRIISCLSLFVMIITNVLCKTHIM